MKTLIKNDKGAAFVEAAILFPIMIMIFAALVLLAIYLPARGVLQRATQIAATTVATVTGDTWLFFDENEMSFFWETEKSNLDCVYKTLFLGAGDIQPIVESIVIEQESRSISSKAGELTVECYVVDYILYREIIVTAKRDFPIDVDLSFIGFPRSIPVEVTSSAVVQDGGEFMRNVDLAVDFIEYISERFGFSSMFEVISTYGNSARHFLGW